MRAHREAIAGTCVRHAAVLLKPHPEEAAHGLLDVAAEIAAETGLPLIGPVADNLYRLLAMPDVTAVLTVSSSAAYEARYFGKTVHTLGALPLRPVWRGDRAGPDDHASLACFVLSADFWRLVLAPHAAVTAMDGARLPPKPNRLRIALDSFWNFNAIDTDRLPARPARHPSA
jgi:hypothetical protein